MTKLAAIRKNLMLHAGNSHFPRANAQVQNSIILSYFTPLGALLIRFLTDFRRELRNFFFPTSSERNRRTKTTFLPTRNLILALRKFFLPSMILQTTSTSASLHRNSQLSCLISRLMHTWCYTLPGWL